MTFETIEFVTIRKICYSIRVTICAALHFAAWTQEEVAITVELSSQALLSAFIDALLSSSYDLVSL